MASLADHAYSHCRAVLVDDQRATDAAIVAVRRGGRSRLSVLAFARYHSLLDGPEPSAADLAAATPHGLLELAAALAATRPLVERAIIDLALRHQLDRPGLGRVLGLAPDVAAERTATVTAAWGAELDPALLAWLGPGECSDLAGVLASAGPRSTIGDVLATGPAVAAHVAGCELCQDRVRSMVSLPDLIGQRPLEHAPEPVAVVARRNRFRPPATPPPSLDPQPRRRWPRFGAVAAVVVAVAVVALGTAAVAQRRTGQDRRNDRVAALTKVAPAGGSLRLSPAVVHAAAGALLLRNTAPKPITWRAAGGAAWLTVSPAGGRLAAGEVAELTTAVLASAPEGDLHTSVTVSGDDGSATGAVVETTVEHSPAIAATVAGCRITANAEDEGAISSVLLHWRAPGAADLSIPMVVTAKPGVYTGALPSGSAGPWWVTAVDDRGNRAVGPTQAAPGC
ncbi:MAG: hypothetical protein QOG64_822 [Acidimicrobiaceae bacterium]|nr:hypothetical protein [Acidimicrobiaceae bacterium]